MADYLGNYLDMYLRSISRPVCADQCDITALTPLHYKLSHFWNLKDKKSLFSLEN